ncbi:hypothetical protein C9374_006556 [Naegleria lovaniensis]|uniref:GPS domain-containing protein n=1 Tax=Naegleria lovaniensis TaxID=51637 RepID=A0AA88KLY6_NAELO|nr:uncharacterized protein C9374_006556 [Naegleria lovaniensis]KAG2379439.1 hypothetical protein C9374_006556 [Naegleria lovaniensis]
MSFFIPTPFLFLSFLLVLILTSNMMIMTQQLEIPSFSILSSISLSDTSTGSALYYDPVSSKLYTFGGVVMTKSIGGTLSLTTHDTIQVASTSSSSSSSSSQNLLGNLLEGITSSLVMSIASSFSISSNLPYPTSHYAFHVLKNMTSESNGTSSYAYIFGGYKTTAIQRASLNALTVFSKVGELPVEISFAASIRTETSLFLVGGLANDRSSGSSNIYYALTNDPLKWTLSSSKFPVAIVSPVVLVYQRMVYIVGGCSSLTCSTKYTSVYYASFNNLTQWTLASNSLPFSVSFASTFMTIDFAYIIEGNSEQARILRAPLTDLTSWTLTSSTFPNMAISRAFTTVGSSIVTAGGSYLGALVQYSNTEVAIASDNTSVVSNCFGILSSNTSYSCNGRGQCLSNDNCQCVNTTYYGDSCQYSSLLTTVLSQLENSTLANVTQVLSDAINNTTTLLESSNVTDIVPDLSSNLTNLINTTTIDNSTSINLDLKNLTSNLTDAVESLLTNISIPITNGTTNDTLIETNINLNTTLTPIISLINDTLTNVTQQLLGNETLLETITPDLSNLTSNNTFNISSLLNDTIVGTNSSMELNFNISLSIENNSTNMTHVNTTELHLVQNMTIIGNETSFDLNLNITTAQQNITVSTIENNGTTIIELETNSTLTMNSSSNVTKSLNETITTLLNQTTVGVNETSVASPIENSTLVELQLSNITLSLNDTVGMNFTNSTTAAVGNTSIIGNNDISNSTQALSSHIENSTLAEQQLSNITLSLNDTVGMNLTNATFNNISITGNNSSQLLLSSSNMTSSNVTFTNTTTVDIPLSFTTCFGVPVNSSMVCSGRGQCIEHDTCQCNSPFFGIDCSKYTCFGILFYEVGKACGGSSRGWCVAPDTCQCVNNYTGSTCQNLITIERAPLPNSYSIISCFGIDSTNTSVCSNGQGLCIANDSCQCFSNFKGTQCEFSLNQFSISLDSNYYLVNTDVQSILDLNVRLTTSSNLDKSLMEYQLECSNCSKLFPSQQTFKDAPSLISLDVSMLSPHATYEFSLMAITSDGAERSIPFRFNIEIVSKKLETQDSTNLAIDSIIFNGLPRAIIFNTSTTILFSLSQIQFNLPFPQFLQEGNCSSSCPFQTKFEFRLVKEVASSDKGPTSFDSSILVTGNESSNYSKMRDLFSLAFSPIITLQQLISIPFESINIALKNRIDIEISFPTFKNVSQILSIPIVGMASVPSDYLSMTSVSPSSGTAILDEFFVNTSEWIANYALFPLTYAFGFYQMFTNERVRVTEYQEKPGAYFPLPYLFKEISNTQSTSLIVTQKKIEIVVFVKDVLGNEQSHIIGVANILPLNQTYATTLTSISLNSMQRLVLAYDQSFLQLANNNTDLVIDVVKNVDLKDIKGSLSALKSFTSETPLLDDRRVVSTVSSQVNNILNTILTTYDQELNDYGYIVNKVSEQVTVTALNVLSDILSSQATPAWTPIPGASFTKDQIASAPIDAIVSSLSKLMLQTATPTILENETNYTSSLPTIHYSSPMLNTTVASFKVKTKRSRRLNFSNMETPILFTMKSENTEVTLDLYEVVEKYSGYDTTLGLSLVSFAKNPKMDNFSREHSAGASVHEFKYHQENKVVELSELKTPILLQFQIPFENRMTLSEIRNISTLNMTSSDNSTILIETKEEAILRCMYWDERRNEWNDFGCELAHYDERTGVATCQCNHTTKFSTFMEFRTKNWTTVFPNHPHTNYTSPSLMNSFIHYEFYVQYVEMGLGAIYTVISLIVLLFLVIFRKHQPVSSRLIAPYLGMVALVIESVLVSIVQRAISVSMITTTNTSNHSRNDDPNAFSWPFTLALVENISLILVNTLNLTAILSYFIQVVRFQFMKALSHKMFLNSQRKLNSMMRHIRWLRFLTSRSLFILLISISIVGNLCFWTLWVVLRRLNFISSELFTTVTSLSYMFIIMGYSIIICIVICIDFSWTSRQSTYSQDSRTLQNLDTNNNNTSLTKYPSFKRPAASLSRVKSESTINDNNSSSNHVSSRRLNQFSQQQRGFLRKLFHLDTPLYFRAEMMLYLVCFLFMMVQLGIGFATQYFENRLFVIFDGKDEQVTQLASASFQITSLPSFPENGNRGNNAITILFILKIIGVLSEIGYTLSYIAIFGGFSLFVLLKFKVKSQHLSQHANTTKKHLSTQTSTMIGDVTSKTIEEELLFEDSEVLSLITDDLGFHFFEEFSEREFSLENLYFYMELYLNQNIISGQELHELPSFIEQLHVNFIASSAPYEVNLPSQAKKMFIDLRANIESLKAMKIISCSNSLNDQVGMQSSMMNQEISVTKNDLPLQSEKTTDLPNNMMNEHHELKELREQLISCFDRLVQEVFVNLGDTFYRFIQTPEYKFYMESTKIKKIVAKQTNMAWIEPNNV